MNDTIKKKLIIKFYDEKLNDNEFLLFKERYEKDVKFASEVRAFVQIRSVQKVLERYRHRKDKKAKCIKVFKSYMLAATLIFFLIATSVITYFTSVQKHHGDLFATYFEPVTWERYRSSGSGQAAYFTDPFDIMTHTDDTADILERQKLFAKYVKLAVNAYNKKNYHEAIPYLRELVKLAPRYADACFFLANSYLATDSVSKAIGIFEKIKGNAHYVEDIKWLLALAYLKNSNRKAAKKELKSLVISGGKYEYYAQAILKEI